MQKYLMLPLALIMSMGTLQSCSDGPPPPPPPIDQTDRPAPPPPTVQPPVDPSGSPLTPPPAAPGSKP